MNLTHHFFVLKVRFDKQKMIILNNTLEPVIQLVEKLPLEQRALLYTYLASQKEIDESEINSIIKICESEGSHDCCPHCHSSKFIKFGGYKGRQRYQCKTCDRTFNELTGTAWHYIHDHSKFRKYFDCLASQLSLRAAAEEVGICLHTSFYWRHKILSAFEKADLKPLKGHSQADDTFVLVSYKGDKQQELKTERDSRKRGGKATKPGISSEQACIVAACDSEKNAVLKFVGTGRLTKDMVFNALGSHIRKQRVNQDIFVTDRHNAYNAFAESKNLNHQTVATSYGQYVNTEGFHIQGVNSLHSRFKKWMRQFNGVATKYLQNYLNYFRLWDKFKNIKERSIYFIRMSIQDKFAFKTTNEVYR